MSKIAKANAGDIFEIEYRNGGALRGYKIEFLGFAKTKYKYGGDAPVDLYPNWQVMKNDTGFKSFSAVDRWAEDMDYGYGLYIWVREVESGSEYAMYRFEGKWVQGSGCDAVTFYPVAQVAA